MTSKYSLLEFTQMYGNDELLIATPNDEKLYTIILLDENAKQKYFIHLLKINNHDVIQPYTPPHPPAGTGDHKYSILIYEQKNEIDPNSLKDTPRSGFNLLSFPSQYNLRLISSSSFIVYN